MVRIYQRRTATMYSGARPRIRGGMNAYRQYRTAANASRARLMTYYRQGQTRGRGLRQLQRQSLRRSLAARIIQRAVRRRQRS
nr:hypothetical protein [Cressdnaviricota sp.]